MNSNCAYLRELWRLNKDSMSRVVSIKHLKHGGEPHKRCALYVFLVGVSCMPVLPLQSHDHSESISPALHVTSCLVWLSLGLFLEYLSYFLWFLSFPFLFLGLVHASTPPLYHTPVLQLSQLSICLGPSNGWCLRRQLSLWLESPQLLL